ncbi:sigma-70 family RNA polymerase sigma factor [Sphingobacterium sp.]|uniref:RNA polymerase sigma factor n=1 Tax=Sphingobacterium sp. TaxID=341027 RepID=UPI002584D742|nr:sigma-70 family RNA polymerase sigma factor [Sphingobacterium sp.]WET67136.1 MAG: sigma-70 family RNA polymerase sigma factor [Sphingobacterium sp.]
MQANVLHALSNANHEVFSEIFEANWEKVFHYFLRKTKDIEESKDLTQQVFVKLWHYREQISFTYSLDEQLFKKARQLFIDWLRKEAIRRAAISNEDNLAQVADPATDSNKLELKHDLKQIVSALPPRRRLIFELKYIHGYSYQEIADQLHISVKTVDNQLSKANAQLRKKLLSAIVFAISVQVIYAS